MSTKFVYVTYIRTTPEKLWEALTKPEFNRAYWYGGWQDCDWKKGSPWRLVFDDGKVADSGKVVEIDPPRKLVLSWRNEWNPEMKAEGYTTATLEIEQNGEMVKLTVTHEIDRDNSTFITNGVSNGWPKILSSLKTLLETGRALPGTDRRKEA